MIQVELKANQTQEPRTYKMGDTFIVDGNPYILASVNEDKAVCLVNIANGSRYDDPIKVDDLMKITSAEFDLCTVDIDSIRKADFKLIEL